MYKFTVSENQEDYSSGRVLHGATGASNFPVRLTSEIFQRAAEYLKQQGTPEPYVIYDPFCGAAYSLTVLGFLHGPAIKLIAASDADANILSVAEKNLALLTAAGLGKRRAELEQLEQSFHKDSHRQALHSAGRLAGKLMPDGIPSQIFQHNSLSGQVPLFDLGAVDLIITDLPYGKLNEWRGATSGVNPAQQFLDNIKNGLNLNAVIAISANKKQEIEHEDYKKLGSFKIGLRKVLFLQLA